MTDPNTHRKLKILMITCFPFFSARGTPIAVKSRLDSLSNLGHEVDVVAYHIGDDIELPGIKILRILNIPFIREVPAGPSLKKIFLDVFIIFKSLHLLLNNKYDLIFTHEEASYFGAFFSRIFKIRHLYDFHSSIPQVMKNFGYEKHKLLINILEFLEKRVINSSHGLIPISTNLDEHIKSINNKIPTVIIEDSQNYDFDNIDKDQADSFKLSEPDLDGKNIIWYAGTFEYYQGLDLLIESAELVIKKRSDVVFVLAGGRQKQVDALRESAKKLCITSNVHFIGSGYSMYEIALYMSISTILISTRIIGDNPPLKIYDYLRAGKPIVATNISAHTQVLDEDVAVLVDPDPESIAKGILSILDDPSYGEALGQRSRDLFEKNFSVQKKTEKTKQILDAVMGGVINGQRV